MNEILIEAHLKIHSGQLDAFKVAVEACTRSVRELDTGTLQYDWFLNGDQSECRLQERYRDSDAALEHMANVGGEKLGQLFSLVDVLSVDVYGTPTGQFLRILEEMHATFYSLYMGIRN